MSDATHGTLGTYTNHGCRCPECKRSWRDYYRTYRTLSKKKLAAHDALLEAAEAAEDTLTRQGYSKNDIDTRGGSALMALRAAIHLAKGNQP